MLQHSLILLNLTSVSFSLYEGTYTDGYVRLYLTRPFKENASNVRKTFISFEYRFNVILFSQQHVRYTFPCCRAHFSIFTKRYTLILIVNSNMWTYSLLRLFGYGKRRIPNFGFIRDDLHSNTPCHLFSVHRKSLYLFAQRIN